MSTTVPSPRLQAPGAHPAPARRRPAPSLGSRMRALVHGARFDRELAEGIDPDARPELSLRAKKLTAPAHRRTLANSLEEAVSVSEHRHVRLSPAAPLATREIRASRSALLELAQALRRRGEVSPQGVAMTQRLLTDGSGPLYVTREHDALWHAARRATQALRLSA